MGKFIILVILVVAGWFGYQWISTPSADQTAVSGAIVDGAPGAAANADVDLNTAEDNANDNTAPATVQTVPTAVNIDASSIPDAFAGAYKKAEALWAQYAKEKGGDATLHDQAPSLAAMYSALLQETYNKPALKNVQLQMVQDRLAPMAARLFFSSKTYKNDESNFFVYHNLKDGELFPDVGREYGMSTQFINILRGEDANNETYHVGEELKLVQAKKLGYFLHIDKSDFYMDVFVCGVFMRRYPIGHGALETETPSGETFIESRVFHPQWTNPNTKQVFNYGEEGHILGPVWMAFNKEIGKSGLGIHGYTGKGQATGARGSNGCIRMKNEQAIELYDVLVPAAYYKSGFQSRAPMRVRIVD